MIQYDEHLLAVLRYIEANPLRAKMVARAEDYRWSTFAVHGLGQTNGLVDRLPIYEALSPEPKVRQRLWSQKVHLPQDERVLDRIRRSVESGLPYGDESWIKRLAKKLDLDLTIRPRGRPRKQAAKEK